MNAEELIGLRDADLTAEERRVRDAHLAAHPDAAAEHAMAMGLTADLAALPVDAPAAPTRRLWGAVPLLAAAAAVGLMVMAPDEVRSKAVTGGDVAAVHLEAAVDGTGLRPLHSGATVGPQEWVAFRIQTDGPGTLTLTETTGSRTRTVYPASGTWSVAAGQHFPGGASPIAWQPDGAAGPRTYTARLCTAPDACTEDTLVLRWEGSTP